MPSIPPPKEHVIGLMTMEVEGKDSARFHRRVQAAAAAFEQKLAGTAGLRTELLTFEGPHLTPAAGAYAPLDFLQIGMTEKLERHLPFLLVITEVDLTASTLSYTLALPSQITNVGIVSTRRLDPTFWGDDADEDLVVARLAHLLTHTFGHLLNLPHHPDPDNAMYDFAGVDALEHMSALTEAQHRQMQRALPREAHERTTRGGRLSFILKMLAANARSIGAAVARANPFSLATKLPTMITAALSVIIVLFFSAEVWDVGSTVELYQLVLFAAAAIVGATVVLYRAFTLGPGLKRGRLLAESTVVTSAATTLCLFLTMLILATAFTALTYFGTITIFPRKLMTTWPTVDPAVRVLDHVKLSLFVGALGLLAGSLGGQADSRTLVRNVLFVDEES